MSKTSTAKKDEVQAPAAAAPASNAKAPVKLTAAQAKKVESMTTWSNKMRYLNSEGYSVSEIAKALGKRYQHVRNVLITPVSKVRID